MDTVQLRGSHKRLGIFHLHLPSSKVKIKSKNAPNTTVIPIKTIIARPTEFVNYAEFVKLAIIRGELAPKYSFSILDHKGPLDHYAPRQVIHNHSVDLTNHLHRVLGVHDFPLCQGPVILPLDSATEEKLSVGQILTQRTVFTHSGDQACGEWEPKATGLSAWNELTNYDYVHACFHVMVVLKSAAKLQNNSEENNYNV